jgi:hypothetical protein
MERRASPPVQPCTLPEIHSPAASTIQDIRLYARANRSIYPSKVLQI